MTGGTYSAHFSPDSLAALEYLYVHCRHPDKVIRGITYGMPRVGNYHLADAVDQKAARREGGFFSRVVNGNDIIPHLPLRIPVKNIFGYWHSDGEIWINPVGAECFNLFHMLIASRIFRPTVTRSLNARVRRILDVPTPSHSMEPKLMRVVR